MKNTNLYYPPSRHCFQGMELQLNTVLVENFYKTLIKLMDPSPTFLFLTISWIHWPQSMYFCATSLDENWGTNLPPFPPPSQQYQHCPGLYLLLVGGSNNECRHGDYSKQLECLEDQKKGNKQQEGPLLGHEDVWCEVCSEEYKVLCTCCGPMEVTSDNPVIMGVENWAQKTLPTSLYLIFKQHYHP